MRTAFIEELFEQATQNKDIMLVVGDLGFGVVTPFIEKLPAQFINAGVAEQNMTGMAAGLAMSGKVVFTYSIANFSTLRCLEQIRNDICYHNIHVTIVSVGGGTTYGNLGYSHHAIEDLAIMRALTNLLVVAPGDPFEARLATRALINDYEGPAYLRLGRAGEPKVYEKEPEFQLGKAITVREGDDLTLISTGGMLYNTVTAADILATEGIHARVLSMHTIKPLDEASVLNAARDTNLILTVEEHSIAGGLGGTVAELLAETDFGSSVYFRRIGLPAKKVEPIVGNQDYLRQHYGLTAEALVQKVKKIYLERHVHRG